ncbi:MAG TPA: hypothetical protein VGI10_19070 [Polyangiaceae bacterium]|jgi:hypothetical protein
MGKTDLDGARAQLAAIARLDRMLEANGLAYWLFGGWAVDFHVGALTRAHGDIDVAVWSHDRERVAALLDEDAWRHAAEPGEDGYTCYERDAIRIDVAFLARDESGRVYTPLRAGRGEWPRDSFGNDRLELLGVRARVISLAALVAEKSVVHDDPQTIAKDRADLTALQRHK